MKKEIICTVCPRGCTVTVEGEGKQIQSVEGYSCKRGLEFASSEFSNPVRLLTTTVKIAGQDNALLPVRSAKPIPKDLLFQCMEVLKTVAVQTPIASHDVIVADICGSGVDIIASASAE